MLTGCVPEETTGGEASQTVTVSLTETSAEVTAISESESEEGDASKAETTVTTVAETTEKMTEKETPAEIKAEGFTYKKPDKDYLLQLIKESEGGQICLAMYADGRLEKCGEDRLEALENRFYYKAIEEMITEEYFEQMTDEDKEMFGVSTYEEYKTFVKEQMFGGNVETGDFEPAVYFMFSGKMSYAEDEAEESLQEVVDYHMS